MSAQPKIIADDLTHEIHAHAFAVEIPELALKRLSRDAKKLLRADAASAYMLLGMIAALAFDHEELRKNHRAAIKLSPSEAMLYRNYIVSLRRVSLIGEALRVAREFYGKCPRDAQAKLSMYETLMLCGRYLEAKDWLTAHPKIAENIDGGGGEADMLPELADIMRSADILDDDVHAVYGLYDAAVSKIKAAPVAYRVWIHERLAVKHLQVPAEFSTVSDMTLRLCQELAATSRYDNVTDYFCVVMTAELSKIYNGDQSSGTFAAGE